MLLPNKVLQLLLQGAKFTEVRGHHASLGRRTCGRGIQGLGSGLAGVIAPHLPSEEVSKGQAALVAVAQPGHVPEGEGRVKAPRLVPAPVALPVLCLHAFPPTWALSLPGPTSPRCRPGLTCRPSWSQSPCLLRGPSSSRGKGQSVGEGELRAQTLEPGGLGLNPSSVTLLKWPGLSEPQFPPLWSGGNHHTRSEDDTVSGLIQRRC